RDPGHRRDGPGPPAACGGGAAPAGGDGQRNVFAVPRQEGWVGFTYTGTPMGTGQHDYPHLLHTVQPRSRGIDEIVEHWLPWQGSAEDTIHTEQQWTRRAIDYLRSTS